VLSPHIANFKMKDGVAHSRDADLSNLVNLNTKIICESNNKNKVDGIKSF
jgi:hypothetical protein